MVFKNVLLLSWEVSANVNWKLVLFATQYFTNSRWLFLQWSFIGWATKLKNSGKQKKGIVTRNKVFFFHKAH